jgi:hypothetical protein
MPMLAQLDPISTSMLLEEIKKASSKADQSGVIYLFVLVIVLFGCGGFVLLRYVLNHAREIHSEANKTLLEISSKFEVRCDGMTKSFSYEQAQLRQVILRVISDARDMVHATRDLATIAVSAKDLLESYRKKEEEFKSKRDRESPLEKID